VLVSSFYLCRRTRVSSEADQLSRFRFLQGFRLGGSSAPARRSNAAVAEEDLDSNVNRTLLEGGLSYESELHLRASPFLSLAHLSLFVSFTEAREVSDYLQEGDAGFKKPKVRPI
jgi:hypothetical protein